MPSKHTYIPHTLTYSYPIDTHAHTLAATGPHRTTAPDTHSTSCRKQSPRADLRLCLHVLVCF